MIWLTEELYFPDPLQTEPHGIVAAGGDLKPEHLLMATITVSFHGMMMINQY